MSFPAVPRSAATEANAVGHDVEADYPSKEAYVSVDIDSPAEKAAYVDGYNPFNETKKEVVVRIVDGRPGRVTFNKVGIIMALICLASVAVGVIIWSKS